MPAMCSTKLLCLLQGFIFADIPDYWKVVSSCCDGLLLVADDEDNLFVVNPTTRETTKVPPLPDEFEYVRGDAVKYGFGYDSVTDDYKVVVHISQITGSYDPDKETSDDPELEGPDEPDDTETFLYVYSFGNGTWKTSNCPHFEVDNPAGVFLRGHIYWLGVWDYYKAAIMDFDLENEVFRCLPHYSQYDYISGCRLAGIGELLWIIDDEKNCWVTKVCDDEEEEPWNWRKLPRFGGPEINPLCLSGEKEMVFSVSQRLSIFNVEEQIPKEIVVHGIEGDNYATTTHTYIETLVSPNDIIENGRE